MRIVFHTHSYLPDTEAGARRISGLAENLVQLGHEVDVICGFPDYINGQKRKGWLKQFKQEENINGVMVHRCFTFPFCGGGTIKRLLNHYSMKWSFGKVKLKGNKVDYLITSAPPLIPCESAIKLAKRFKCKLVYDVRDIWPDVAIEMGSFKENDFKARSFAKIANKLYRHADLITTVSQTKVVNLDKKLINYNKNAELISNGVDDYFINQEEDKNFLKEYALDKYFSVVHVGKIGLAQNVDMLLDLAKEYLSNKKIRFFLLGDGVKLNHILNRIKEENLTNVVYCGKRTMQECYTALKHAKLSYISLVNENLKDSVPTKLFEALYTGCPCLLSACGESAEIVEKSKFGLVSHPSDYQKLCENFEVIINDYDKIYKNKKHCFDYINDNFNRKNVAKKLEELLKERL